MSSEEWSRGRKRMIEDQAQQELAALNLLHPDRFDYLKLELKSFILLLQSQSPTSLAPDSQESSSCKKRRKVEKRGDEMDGEDLQTVNRRVDLVLERAVLCLRKIRRFKTALFSTA